MFAVKSPNSCFTKNLLRKPSDQIRRKLYGNSQHDGSGSFSKTVPQLVYLHNPLMYLWTQFQLSRIRLFWDREFKRDEFYRGSKQSATVMTDCIREQDHLGIGHFTTPVGYQQITRDMTLSRNDARLQVLRFRYEDFHRAIPVKVVLFKKGNHRSCFIDMLFVGMRNTKDFQNLDERQLIEKTLCQLENQQIIKPKFNETKDRILFAEIYMRFFRNFTPRVPGDWLVSFYKIVSFNVLNYK